MRGRHPPHRRRRGRRHLLRPGRGGLLVSHDEPESGPGVDEDRDPTNFSYVDWGGVANALDLEIDTTPSNDDPRFR
jgi:3-phytase